jgi:hypothetical protein
VAISRDASSNGGLGQNVSSLSWSHTLAANASKLIVAAAAFNSSPLVTVSGITCGGRALTHINGITDNSQEDLELWYLDSPPAGAQTIAITFSGTASSVRGMAVSYIGTAAGIDSSAAGQNNTAVSSFSQATTVVASYCWLVGNAWISFASGVSISGGSGTSIVVKDDATTADFVIADSNGITGTGSQALNYSASSSTTWYGAVTASIAPAPPPAWTARGVGQASSRNALNAAMPGFVPAARRAPIILPHPYLVTSPARVIDTLSHPTPPATAALTARMRASSGATTMLSAPNPSGGTKITSVQVANYGSSTLS